MFGDAATPIETEAIDVSSEKSGTLIVPDQHATREISALNEDRALILWRDLVARGTLIFRVAPIPCVFLSGHRPGSPVAGCLRRLAFSAEIAPYEAVGIRRSHAYRRRARSRTVSSLRDILN
jgi:hypothetical protein